MHEVHRRSRVLSWQHVKPAWLPLDALVQYTNALLGLVLLVLAPRTLHARAYLALHLTLAGAIYLLAKRDDMRSRPADALTFLHHWLPAVFILLVYFELGLLIPLLRSYGDHRYDRALQAIDVWLLGDPVAAISSIATPLLSDILAVCYIAYYPIALSVPAVLYARGSIDDYQRVATIILTAFLLSYAGYLAWPALGPHRLYDLTRPAALDGSGFAHYVYQWFRGVPDEPPDAFPSGHALIGVLCPALAWRWVRPLFYWLVPLGVGVVFATVYLRFHYLTDVVAGIALVPVAWRLGSAVERRYRGPLAQPSALEASQPQT